MKWNKCRNALLVLVLTVALLAGCAGGKQEGPTGAPTAPATVTTAPGEELTSAPTEEPTSAPTEEPTSAPSEEPTGAPSEEPTGAPTEEPTSAPSEEPTGAPTEEPTSAPSEEPTGAPTEEPTSAPTEEPTKTPTPTKAPTKTPTPTKAPTKTPTPTKAPTKTPTPTKAPTKTPTPTPTQAATLGLKDAYAEDFRFGTCVTAAWGKLNDSVYAKLIRQHFNSITCENEMKPDAMLNRAESQRTGRVVVSVGSDAKKILEFAKKHGMKVRGHVLVWHSQTPEWFFREGFEEGGALVGREEMLARMESYIEQVLTYCHTNYPGVIDCWDVANEIFTDNGGALRDSNWVKTIGTDFVDYAFRYARKYAEPGTKLFYNDFNTYMSAKTEDIKKLANRLKKEGLIDGIGMQSHLDVDFPSAELFCSTIEQFNRLGLEVQITELDVTTDYGSAGEQRQADLLRAIFRQIATKVRAGQWNITSVTVWGVRDTDSWRNNYTDWQGKKRYQPLLFNAKGEAKMGFYAVLDPFSEN